MLVHSWIFVSIPIGLFYIILTMYRMFSQRGHELLVYDDYKYRKTKLTQNRQKWRCTVKTCKGFIFTDVGGIVLLSALEDHNHPKCGTLAREFVLNNAKRKAITEASKYPKQLIKKEIESVPGVLRQELTPQDHSLSQRVYSARKTRVSENNSVVAGTTIYYNVVTDKGNKLWMDTLLNYVDLVVALILPLLPSNNESEFEKEKKRKLSTVVL